jgi:dihydrofolate synthase/folylpolyglutamate synthase
MDEEIDARALYNAVRRISRSRPPHEAYDLGRMRQLMTVLGDPLQGLRVVHVGGTAGKGSTARMIADMMTMGGWRVGLYTKPHLQSVTERLLIDGKAITGSEFRRRAEELGDISGDIWPTWFEAVSALALKYFSDHALDLAVIEVGMGGTTDATNVVDPIISVITNVGDDHLDLLGGSLRSVATHKSGIIKSGSVAVSGVDQPELAEIVRQRAMQVGSRLSELGQEIVPTIETVSEAGSTFHIQIHGRQYSDLRVQTLGRHQVSNAALAVTAVTALADCGLPVAEDAWRAALQGAWAPGRMEKVGTAPLTVLDGAHCPPKMQALASSVEEVFGGYRRRIAVVAMSPGRDQMTTLRAIAPRLDMAVVTSFEALTDIGTVVGQPPHELAEALARANPELIVRVVPDPREAYRRAREAAGADDLILVTGSFYLVGIIRPMLKLGWPGDAASGPGVRR